MNAYPIHPRSPVLVTGFEPFGGESCNASWQAVQLLEGESIAGRRIETACLPVTFSGAPVALAEAVARHEPALVIAVGQASGRCSVSLERVAINLIDARIADNAGDRPIDNAIDTNGPAAAFARLPIKRLFSELRAAGLPVEVSYSAGTYVCNQVFYELLRVAPQTVPCGFIHVPCTPEQAAACAGMPSMSADVVAEALRLILTVALRGEADLALSAGREC